MGRRKRRVVRVVKKRLPKVLLCPKCGVISVRVVTSKSEEANKVKFKVVCGSCGLNKEYIYERKLEYIDVYNRFVDEITKGVTV
ncbi:hypothetical protein HRbin06_00427 [archaeon HR06]|nr:hypothetical protein HRbin06_00427 [archaeon HR06]